MSEVSRRSFLKGSLIGATSIAALAATGCAAPKGAEGDRQSKPTFVPGVYYGIGKGRGGAITAEVTLSENAIEQINIIAHSETPVISDAPISLIPQHILKHQSLAVDAVSHATLSSSGVIDSIRNAIAGSGFDPNEINVPFESDPIERATILQSDIAIVGGGTAGLCAAIRAAQLGVRVVLFEQSAHLGGDALFAEGWLLGAGTLMQTAAGEEDSGEKCWQDMLDNWDKESKVWYDYDLGYKYHINTGRTVDWLDQYIGVRFHDREITHGTYGGGNGFAHRLYYTNGGVNLIKPLINKLNEGIRDGLVTLLYETEVIRVLTDNGGAVCGLEAMNRNGDAEEYSFKAVLLATGGYHYNREMVEKYYNANILSGGGSTATGSGFKICEDLGREFTNMQDLSLVYAGGLPSRQGITTTIQYAAEESYPGAVWVDIHGKRAFNETASKLIGHAAWRDADQSTMNIVFPVSARLKYRGPIIRAGAQDVPFTPNESWALFDEMLAEGKYIFEADSPEELAEKLGIDDIPAFSATIKEINDCVASGQSDSLGRASFPSFTGKLYGLKTFTILHNTFGAVQRNSDSQPIDKDGNAIEGLYAAGELCGIGLVNPPTTVNILGGGIGIGGCSNMGRIAIETIINKLTGMATELEPYVFEGDPADYDTAVYESGDFIGLVPLFEK
jgi:uncharacterized protein with FMN-binding domain/predicted oxidoreductase